MENVVAKEHICMTHGHVQWSGDCLKEWGMLSGRAKWEKSGQL